MKLGSLKLVWGSGKVLQWDEVKQLEAGVGLRQRHEEGSMPLVPRKASWTRATHEGVERGIWVRCEEVLEIPSGLM